MAIKAIQTKYKGYHFRSRLEARWAVFFDALGLQWEYEPEGFDLGDGVCYLPDFYLPIVGGGIWVEIKHARLNTKERKDANIKISDVADITMKAGIIFMGDPLDNVLCDGDPPGNYDGTASWIITPDGSDGPYLFCICPWTGEAGIEFDGRGDRVSGHLILTPDQETRKANREAIDCESFYGSFGHGDKSYSGQHPKLFSAASKARSARFEHGETPK